MPSEDTNGASNGREDAFKDIAKLLEDISNLRIRRAKIEMEPKVQAHLKRLGDIVFHEDTGSDFDAWKRTFEELRKEYSVWEQRQRLLDESNIALTQNLWLGQGSSTSPSQWMASGGQNEWLRGTCSLPEGSPLSAELISVPQKYDPNWRFGVNESPDISVGVGSMIIVGYKVISHWTDGTNGEWQARYANPERVTVLFRSRPHRACNWELTVYMVPKDIYAMY